MALVDQVNDSSDSVRARVVSAMDQLFMVVKDLGSYGRDACCIVSQVKLKIVNSELYISVDSFLISYYCLKCQGCWDPMPFWVHVGSCAQLLTAASCIVWTLDLVKMETEISERSCDKPRDATISLSF